MLHRQRQDISAEFRRQLTIGSETFCGPVINIRGPMVQIALNGQLPEFSAEPWLRLENVYPATLAGCGNINNHLEPVWR